MYQLSGIIAFASSCIAKTAVASVFPRPAGLRAPNPGRESHVHPEESEFWIFERTRLSLLEPRRLPHGKKRKKPLSCRHNLNRVTKRPQTRQRSPRIESGAYPIPERLQQALQTPRMLRIRIADRTFTNRKHTEWPPQQRLWGQVSHFRHASAALGGRFHDMFCAGCPTLICSLRLAPVSGISTHNGDVAEWLKAAVC